MSTRARRRELGTPLFSGRSLAGAVALLTALGFGAAAVPALVSQPLPRPGERARKQEARARVGPVSTSPATAPSSTSPSSPSPSIRPEQSPEAPARAGNRPPVVSRADFGNRSVTTRGDLRLQIEAWDPDGDPLTIRTTWHLDDREIQTETPVLPRSAFARGEELHASVVALDGSDESPAFETETVVVENAPPTITTFPKGFDATGSFVYPLGAVDPDGDRNLSFRLREGPDGMRLEAHEGTLTWRPGPEQAGRHRVVVEVDDGRGGVESQVFVLQVRIPRPPDADLAER